MAYDLGKGHPDVKAARNLHAAFLKRLRYKKQPAVKQERDLQAKYLRRLRYNNQLNKALNARIGSDGKPTLAVDRKQYFEELVRRHPLSL